jgi:large subunit ribosomal protein L9
VKIVLRTDVENLGKKGDLCEVADGYARNYLVPRGLAMRATKGVVAQAESMRRSRSARDRREREAAEAIAGRLSGQRITVPARAGEGGKLFGSVGTAAIGALAGHEVDRRTVVLDEPIKELGETEVSIRLHAEVVATVTVEVVAE